jgi:hypothetical protein
MAAFSSIDVSLDLRRAYVYRAHDFAKAIQEKERAGESARHL